MRKEVGAFTVDNGSYVERFSLIDMGNNHCQIRNIKHILFDGFYCQGALEFENKKNEQKMFADFAGWKFAIIK